MRRIAARWCRRLSQREIRELFQIRVEMESLAARLAAEAAEPEERAQFAEEIQMIFDEAPRRVCVYLKENAAFHEAIMRLAGNRQLRDLSMRLHLPLIMAQVGDALTVEVLRTSVREHRAIAEGDPRAGPRRRRRRDARPSRTRRRLRPGARPALEVGSSSDASPPTLLPLAGEGVAPKA